MPVRLYSLLRELICDEIDIEKELSVIFDCTPIDVIDNLSKSIGAGFLEQGGCSFDFKGIKYSDIFNSTVEKFLQDDKNLTLIKDYEMRYSELLSQSPIFKRGVFSHNDADTVSAVLSENGFFSAEHEVILHGIGKEIKSSDELKQTVQSEKDKIFSDETLKKSFNKINATLSKRTLSQLRIAIEKHPDIIPLLSNYTKYRKEIWVYLLKSLITDLNKMQSEYDSSQAVIARIKLAAENERTQWDKVYEIFRARFTLPVEVKVPNQVDVALSDIMPEFIFKYIDKETGDEAEIPRKDLEKVLSQGEKRALYLLNIINDLESIRLSNEPHLIIVDDIAESFDYKNKYAIIEYLQEMMLDVNLNFIILSHNFDFYRTVANRAKGIVQPFMVQQITGGLEIKQPKFVFKNPFSDIKKNVHNKIDKDILTAIPFVRNLIEYTSGTDNTNYAVLTSLLHMKVNTKSITLSNLQNIFNAELKDKSQFDFANDRENKTVYDLIFEVARQQASDNVDIIDLDGKIIISMAVRLLSEEYIIKSIKENGTELGEITSNQTGRLVKKYAEIFPDELQNQKIFNRVLLMVSENIHINSFMFEPLIDISIESLIRLFGEVSILCCGQA